MVITTQDTPRSSAPPPTAVDLAARTMVAPLLLLLLSSRCLSTWYSLMNNFGADGHERNKNVPIERTPPENAG